MVFRSALVKTNPTLPFTNGRRRSSEIDALVTEVRGKVQEILTLRNTICDEAFDSTTNLRELKVSFGYVWL